jgi:hypothetical protein
MLEKSVIQLYVINRWQMAGPFANYWWHPRLFHKPQGLAVGAQGHLDTCSARKQLWPLQKSYQCIWWDVNKKFLNDTYMLREPGLMNSSSTHNFKKHQTEKNTWRDIISNNVLWKKTHYHLYANGDGNPNSPESMPEAITRIEIISSKPMMHMDTCIRIPGHTLGIVNECWVFPPQTLCKSWSLE